MKAIIAIVLTMALSVAQAAETYFGVYGVGESERVRSCSGDCPAYLKETVTPIGATIGVLYGDHVQVGAESMLSEEPAVLAKVRYNFSRFGFEFGAGVESQKVELAVMSGASKTLYRSSRATGPVILAGVSLDHFVLSYLVSEATHDQGGLSSPVIASMGAIPESRVMVREKYVRLEYRIDF